MKHVFSTIKAALLCGALVLGLSACGGSGSSSTTAATSTSKAASWANVTIASGNKQVTLSWTDTTIAAGSTSPAPTYNIYYATAPGVKKSGVGSGVTKISNVTSPYVHTGLTNGQPYYYVITAVSTSGVEGAESNEVSAVPQVNKPAAPVGLKVTADDGQVTLDLVDSTGAHITPPTGTTYNIYWSQSGNVTLASNKIGNVTFSSTGFTHTGLTNSTPTSLSTYYYAVTAQTVDGESDLSQQVSVTVWPQSSFAAKNAILTNNSTSTNGKPSIPFKLSAYAGNQQVALTIPASTQLSNPNYYFKAKDNSITYDSTTTKIQYNVNWTNAILSTSGTITISDITKPFVHQALTNGTSYCYTVSAVATPSDLNTFNPAFASAVLTKECVTPTAKTAAIPSGLTAATGSQQVALSWNKDKSGYANVYYNVYASSTAGIDTATMINNKGKYLITSTTNSSFLHSGLTSGTTYYYTVTSVAEGESAPCSLVAATP
ncbi:fibronectin type III domain-containing protein [Geobacter argillaceus]|uniref:Fibronectin type-III domain-containing protein n=1 Tax=Geobacter argillaceus TaxID=345631 RepID=A0A562VG16_9BACT|nr:hypothetical protein [Geobacter argillaceus]TWJ16845.1 hypothetical protein JN12_03204 [Geobacter argillaceus]